MPHDAEEKVGNRKHCLEEKDQSYLCIPINSELLHKLKLHTIQVAATTIAIHTSFCGDACGFPYKLQ